ncbi:tetratricopeptide repeat protein [Alteraurantiacibacter palmitatis]|uniref:Tetratricopeptide repeat protein n=1 Tax=Alteraurantiacibacter palmitatis TaxID=2054628 RepID=A0ABV7E933_9SPHN
MARTMAFWRGSGTAVTASLMAVGLALGTVPQAAWAQSQPSADQRLQSIERQLRALQRAVFPGGDQRFFEAEITAPSANAPTPSANAPTPGALTGVLDRLEAIELQLARMTEATEINQNALMQMETRLAALEQRAASAPVAQALPTLPAPSASASASASGGAASGAVTAPAAAAAAAPAAAAPAPSAERLARVQAVLKPATADPGDDEYVYGFRLWEAQLYPEAQQQLALFLERYPNHPRVTFGRNLLGRAYLDAGDPRRAATFFFENYQANKQAARAPDSLLFLAESMIALNDTNRACIALAEFGETYPALATGRLAQQYDAARGRVRCQ